MIHRFGALLVGLVLVLEVEQPPHGITAKSPAALNSSGLQKSPPVIWMLNATWWAVPSIVFAKVGDFPEWLSLLHLVVGVGAFLSRRYF